MPDGGVVRGFGARTRSGKRRDSAETQLQHQHCPGQQQRDAVGDDDGPSSQQDAVCQPERQPDQKQQRLPDGNIPGMLCPPGTCNLRENGSAGKKSGNHSEPFCSHSRPFLPWKLPAAQSTWESIPRIMATSRASSSAREKIRRKLRIICAGFSGLRKPIFCITRSI